MIHRTYLAIALILWLAGRLAFSQCLVEQESVASAGERKPIRWDGVVDDPKQRRTIRWMGIADYPSARDGSWIQRRLEKYFNIELKPIFLDWPAFSNRRPLMFCGGQTPDVFWDGDPLTVRRNVKNGFVLELPYELLLKHAPTYVKQVNQYGREAWLYSYWHGKNWGIPTFAAGAPVVPRPGVWRLDWLKKVGIDKIPDTMEEMHEAFRRFTFDDPDGDGIKDTYGLCPETHWSLMFAEFFMAYGVLPGDFMERDGKVVWGGILPETKKVLGILRQWYREGLIDPDYVTGERVGGSVDQKFISGMIGYRYDRADMAKLDLSAPNSLYSQTKALNPNAVVVPSAPLIGVDGRRRGRCWGGAAHVIQLARHLEEEPEKVLRILHMFEAYATDETLSLEARTGRRGVHWNWTPQRGMHLLPPYDGRPYSTQEMLDANLVEGLSFFAPSAMKPEWSKKYLRQEDRDFCEQYRRPEWGVMNVLGKSDVVDSASEYLDDLRQYQENVFSRIVRGDCDLAFFDAFVVEWKRRGGDILTREANEMFSIMPHIYQKAGIDPDANPARGTSRR